MRDYAQLLRHWPLAPLFATGALARLPQTMNGLGLLLFVYAATGSYVKAGAVVGGVALGMGAGGPLVGRAADRRGPQVLIVAALTHAAALAGLLIVGGTAPSWLLVTLAALAGVAFPPTHSVLRARLPLLLRDTPHLLVPAYALDSVLVQLTFVSGPLLVGVLATFGSPTAAVVAAGAACVVGPVAFLRFLPAAEQTTSGEADWLGPLRSPAIVTIVLAMLPFGIALGALEVMLPAFSELHGSPGLAGFLLALWAAGGAAGGLAYGARRWQTSASTRHAWLSAAYPLTFVPMLASSSIAAMAVFVVPAGLLVGPIFASRNELVGANAPSGTETEALTWPMTAVLCGMSLGAALSGSLVQHAGWHASVGLAITSALGASAIVTMRQRSLSSPESTAA